MRTTPPWLSAAHTRRGSFIVGMLMVLLIIMIVLFVGPFGVDEGSSGVPRALRDLDRGKDAACAGNRGTLRTNITMLQIENPRLTQADPAVVQLMANARCPGGGVYVFDGDGSIRCTEHDPPSVAALMAMVQLPQPTAEELRNKPEPNPLIKGKAAP